MSVSVVVPVLDDAEQLKGLLSSLRGQGAEVVCGDGGSRDGSIKIASSMGARCIVKAGGNGIECTNLAASMAQGDILLFTASDVRMKPGTVSEVKRQFGDPALLGLTGWPILYDGSALCKIEYAIYFLLASMFDRIRFVSTGNFLAVRRSAFDGFEQSYNNDGQFGAKLKKKGKTKLDRKLRYYVSARTYNRLGFFAFNRLRFYALENFLP